LKFGEVPLLDLVEYVLLLHDTEGVTRWSSMKGFRAK